MEKLIGFAVALAFTLAAAGQLPRATLWLIHQIPPGGPQLISLRQLNRALIGGGQEVRAKRTRHLAPKGSP